MRHLGNLKREVALATIFDGSGAILDVMVQADGAQGWTQCRYRPLFKRVFDLEASGFVLAHNHPSGDPAPSAPDISATRKLLALGRAMEVDFFDHVVVGGRAAVSMRRAGMMK